MTLSRSCAITVCTNDFGGVLRCVLTSSGLSSVTSGVVRHRTVGPEPTLQLCRDNSRKRRCILDFIDRQQNRNTSHQVSDGSLCLST